MASWSPFTAREAEMAGWMPFTARNVLGVMVCVSVLLSACGDSSESSSDPIPQMLPMESPTATATLRPTPDETPNLVTEGARIFFQETFDGNGRTCGTCHRAEASFTLTPALIATLSPDDPLFVAERNPDLAALENPDLLRSRALILENIDGFDRPPVFRGVPHVFNQAFTAPFGWSADVGTLTAFATAAVIQHFPRTLERIPGVDFRLPSPEELAALEAFMLSLPLPSDARFDVASFLASPSEERGAALFFGEAKCGSCHGGSLLTDNASFPTGVTARTINTIPPPECDPPCAPIGPREAGGARPFNVPSLFGLANTAPFFHDNSSQTVRDAVAFYASAEFNGSLGASLVGGIQLTDAAIDDLTAFLEALTPCGNGVADHGEPCDDGNQLDGDGCRPNCTLERCGDGIVDPAEQCDDGNPAEPDGCGRSCGRDADTLR